MGHLAKAIWFDGSGWCVLAKRLEAGSFQLPHLDGNAAQVSIDGSAFASLLAGIDFTAARRGWYRRPTESARKAIKTIDMENRELRAQIAQLIAQVARLADRVTELLSPPVSEGPISTGIAGARVSTC